MTRLVFACLCVCVLIGWAVPTSAQNAPLPDSPRAARIRSDLRQILQTGGYQPERPGEGLLTKVGKWISEQWTEFTEWLRRFFGFGGRVGAGSTPFLPYVLVVALILLIAYAIAYVVKNYRRAPAKGRRKLSVETVIEPEESAAAEPDAWIAAARRHASAGDYRKAYRAVFIAILIRLDRRGAIRFERSKTNGDYVRSLRGAPDLLAFLRPIANDFDARWYGHLDTTEPDFHAIMSRYDSVPGETSPA